MDSDAGSICMEGTLHGGGAITNSGNLKDVKRRKELLVGRDEAGQPREKDAKRIRTGTAKCPFSF